MAKTPAKTQQELDEEKPRNLQYMKFPEGRQCMDCEKEIDIVYKRCDSCQEALDNPSKLAVKIERNTALVESLDGKSFSEMSKVRSHGLERKDKMFGNAYQKEMPEFPYEPGQLNQGGSNGQAESK